MSKYSLDGILQSISLNILIYIHASMLKREICRLLIIKAMCFAAQCNDSFVGLVSPDIENLVATAERSFFLCLKHTQKYNDKVEYLFLLYIHSQGQTDLQ